MQRDIKQTMNPICTFRESCNELAVGELPLPESLSKPPIYACSRHFGEAQANGYFTQRFGEPETVAIARCNRITDARHMELRGTLDYKFNPNPFLKPSSEAVN